MERGGESRACLLRESQPWGVTSACFKKTKKTNNCNSCLQISIVEPCGVVFPPWVWAARSRCILLAFVVLLFWKCSEKAATKWSSVQYWGVQRFFKPLPSLVKAGSLRSQACSQRLTSAKAHLTYGFFCFFSFLQKEKYLYVWKTRGLIRETEKSTVWESRRKPLWNNPGRLTWPPRHEHDGVILLFSQELIASVT